MSKPKPVEKFVLGRIQAAIWKNEREQDGETRIKYSVQIQKTFKGDGGNYQDTNNYFPSDLLNLAHVARQSLDYITSKKRDTSDAI